ncbi:hypothetical protein CTI12_AA442060 [Artemisia annua]|uniref:Uncharacterized protein n=1 Tax=Artemisia annua TaxID=35608 RepID=A0A2U1LWW6_ARTAN|nr:hypothetical protein CTI12_AA442060 [Artemisia annua]
MHAKSDSDLTSVGEQDQTLALTPPRTPRHHRPLYYVQSPSNHDHDKMSFGSSPFGSPGHHHYHCSPIHHSHRSEEAMWMTWRTMMDDAWSDLVVVSDIVFISCSTIPSSGNEPVKRLFIYLGSFSATPLHFFWCSCLSVSPGRNSLLSTQLASGHVKKFYQSRKSQRVIVAQVLGYQMPLYGGVSPFNAAIGHLKNVIVPVNLTFVMRSRAYVLGRLVKPKFYKKVLCQVTLHGNRIGKHVNLTDSCIYHD